LDETVNYLLILFSFFSPLSRDMVEYARLDTHYLINCWQYLMKTSRTSLSNYSVI